MRMGGVKVCGGSCSCFQSMLPSSSSSSPHTLQASIIFPSSFATKKSKTSRGGGEGLHHVDRILKSNHTSPFLATKRTASLLDATHFKARRRRSKQQILRASHSFDTFHRDDDDNEEESAAAAAPWPANNAGMVEATDQSALNKAFSSMVFIVRELHSYTLELRQIKGILERVQADMNASFVWLFQHVFSSTPTLMLSLMLLLANFTIYSITHNSINALAATHSPSHLLATTTQDDDDQQILMLHRRPSTFSESNSKEAISVGGGGGGVKTKPVLGGITDDGGPHESSDGSSSHFTSRPIDPNGTGSSEEEVWNGIVEEASRMKVVDSSDHTLLQSVEWVSPVSVKMEAEDESSYLHTELMYQQALSQDPDNILLLSNFAQFLFLVLHDHDRAEYYFKRATIGRKPADAEALNRYANFLWLGRKDLEAAEETYLEAIEAQEPCCSAYYTASYAHFLWNTGADDTCYPLYDGDDDASLL